MKELQIIISKQAELIELQNKLLKQGDEEISLLVEQIELKDKIIAQLAEKVEILRKRTWE